MSPGDSTTPAKHGRRPTPPRCPACQRAYLEAAVTMGGVCIIGCPSCGYVETEGERRAARQREKALAVMLDRRYARMRADGKARQLAMFSGKGLQGRSRRAA